MFNSLFCSLTDSVNLGYDIGVSTNAGPLLQQDPKFALTDPQLELFLGSINFWSILGALLSPLVTDRYGRRATFVAAAIGFLLGVAIMSTAISFEILMVGRFFVGVGVGVGEAVDPMYIAEMAPKHVRGELVSWAEAGVAVGVVLGFCSSLVASSWRGMLGLGAAMPLVMMGLVWRVMPESPRWLVAQHQESAARVILERIYPNDQVDEVVNDISSSLALEEAASNAVGWGAILRPCPAVRRMLIVGVGTAIIQQAVGIDSIMFYLMFVIAESGITSENGKLAALIMLGLVKLAFVFVGAKLFDHLGRRPLMFISLLGTMSLSRFDLCSLCGVLTLHIVSLDSTLFHRMRRIARGGERHFCKRLTAQQSLYHCWLGLVSRLLQQWSRSWKLGDCVGSLCHEHTSQGYERCRLSEPSHCDNHGIDVFIRRTSYFLAWILQLARWCLRRKCRILVRLFAGNQGTVTGRYVPLLCRDY